MNRPTSLGDILPELLLELGAPNRAAADRATRDIADAVDAGDWDGAREIFHAAYRKTDCAVMCADQPQGRIRTTTERARPPLATVDRALGTDLTGGRTHG